MLKSDTLSDNQLAKSLAKWYAQNERSLPWRESKDPYIIWLSEVILQQTRVEQGLPYFLNFSKHFPTVKQLAEAEQDDVLKLWQGLGYYSRARNLHAAAKQVVADFGGQFPKKYDDLLKLKGVGPYTAAAIASIAGQEPKAVVDGNVIRVISRLYGITAPVNEHATLKQIQAIADALLDHKSPGQHNQAMMEFGALHCVPKKPNCTDCPVQGYCIAYKNDLVTSIPLKTNKTKRRSRFLHFFIVSDDKHLWIQKRGENDIWAGLYQFPLMETAAEKILEQSEIANHLGLTSTSIERLEKAPKHVLSHQDLFATFYLLETAQLPKSDFLAIKPSELHTFAVPRLIDRYLEKHPI